MERIGREWRSDEKGDEGQELPGLHGVNATDENPLGIKNLPSPAEPQSWLWLGLFAFVLVSMAMLATALVVTAAKDKKASLLRAEEKRLQESVTGRVKVLETWLAGHRMASRRLTDSRVFRLFVNDLALQKPSAPLPRFLQDQRPYFRQLMADFARQNDLKRATVLGTDGAVLLSSPGPALPVTDLLRRVENVEPGGNIVLSSIRPVSDRDRNLVVDAIMAFPPAQAGSEGQEEPLAILVLTLPMNQILEDILSDSTADPDHEQIALLQQRGDLTDRFRMTTDGVDLTTAVSPKGIRPGAPLAFGRRDDDGPVYSLGKPVETVPWSIYQALDARAALSPVHGFIKVAAGLSAMAVLALTATFSALWWRQGRNHHRRMVDLYKNHAWKTHHERQFLQSITTSIDDWLTVSSREGELIYTNPAFEDAISRSGLSIAGKRWGDLVNESPIAGATDNGLVNLIDGTRFDVVDVGSNRHVVSTHVSDLKAEDGSFQGTVRIVRDQTELVAERRRRLLAMTQTVDAFIHAIELRDPFLLGHTRRLRDHAIAIGLKLGLSDDAVASLALAASLSQIGKIFIPDDVLTKPDRHGPDEEVVMRRHIGHAIDLLERIDFDLPIIDSLAQMHERLDGSGYPHGLSGDRINLSARILGVADVFCARTAPRSYRDRMSAGKTLYHLASNEQRYDLKVVAALAEIVGRDHEPDIPNTARCSFIDAEIWQGRQGEAARLREPA